MHLNVFVSQKCFVHCRGCYSYSREEKEGTELKTEQLIKFLNFAYNEGVEKVTLCGGDPLTRNDIIDLLERIKKIGFAISLDTVGSSIVGNCRIDKNTIIQQTDAKKIANLVNMIGIPIDGSTNEVFKRFRPTDIDIVEQQLRICQELHKFGANICINTVAHKGNLEDAYELAKLIKSLSYIHKWQIFQYEPLGKFGLMNREMFEITDKQFANFQSTVLTVFDNDISKVQFKASRNRKNAYMLIDNSGNVWIPTFDNMLVFECSYRISENTIIGNITKPKDWYRICSYLDRRFT